MTILTKELLLKWDACEEGISFCERNKLFGFDLSRIDEIKGDYNKFIEWLKEQTGIHGAKLLLFTAFIRNLRQF